MLLKRIGVTICVCLIVLFSVPSIPAYAYDGDYVMYLPNSYNLYEGVLAAQSKIIIGNSSNLSNFVQDKFDSINSFMQSNYSNYDIMHYSGSPSDSGEGYLHIFDGVTNGRVFFYSASQASTAVYQNCVVISDTPFTFSYRRVNNNGSTIGSSPAASPFYQCGTCVYNGNTYYFAGDNTNFYSTYQYNGDVTFNNTSYASDLQHGSSSVNLRYSSFPVYTAYEDSTIPTSGFLYFKDLYKILEGSFTPINDPVNAFTSFGVVDDYDTGILPDEVVFESNSNHMYFNSCEFGFCEPKGISTYNQFGGAYIYCRYVVDDWVVNHISDYSIMISMETLLDEQRYFRTLTYPLDRDGCLTLPFKNFGLTGDDNVTQGFVVVGNNNQTIDTDYFKVNLFSITTERSKEQWFQDAANAYNTLKAFDRYDTIDFSDVTEFYNSNVAKYNRFTINLRAVLVSGEDNSGAVARSFNLVTGSDIATDTSGLDNDNPFVPDDTDPEYVPDLPSGTNSTSPTVIINNGGTWQGTFTGGFDPGYRELKQDIDSDPNGNFTQYLDPLKNDSLGEWFMSFINAFPPELKVLLISGTAAGVGFGIYRFVRRG